jgi:hypothetical protein
MMRTLPGIAAVALLWLAGCGKPPAPTPDAGVDDSCGIDCEAQARFGLLAERCFEYSDAFDAQEPPALGVWVRPVRELEGGVRVIPVEYLENGIRRMEDLFLFTGGELRLARRVWTSTSESVTYRDADANIVGVAWWQPGIAPGVNFKTSAQAEVLQAGMQSTQPTTLAVVGAGPTAAEQTVPHGAYPDAVKLLFNEDPPHGTDARRVFAEGVGFTLFSSRLALSGGTSRELRLQAIRDVGTEDGGAHACGFSP